MGLLVSDPLIHERRLVCDDELFAATITPQGTHFLEIRGFLSALTLFYCHCLHLLNFLRLHSLPLIRLSAFAPGSLHSEQHGLAQLFLEFSRSS